MNEWMARSSPPPTILFLPVVDIMGWAEVSLMRAAECLRSAACGCVSVPVCVFACVCQLYKQRGRPSPWQRVASPYPPVSRRDGGSSPGRLHVSTRLSLSEAALLLFFCCICFPARDKNYLGKICMGEKEGGQCSSGSFFSIKTKVRCFFFVGQVVGICAQIYSSCGFKFGQIFYFICWRQG